MSRGEDRDTDTDAGGEIIPGKYDTAVYQDVYARASRGKQLRIKLHSTADRLIILRRAVATRRRREGTTADKKNRY